MSPYVPITPAQIIEEAVAANKAGAAVVHIHARDPRTGEPDSNLGLMEEIVGGIKCHSDVAVCITTGASQLMTADERLAPVGKLRPELATCNAGSINFCLAPAAKKVTNPKFPWEIRYLEATRDNVFSNTFVGLEKYITTMNENGTRPEFEVYDAGMINNIAYFLHKGLVKRPVYVQFVLGILGGLPATVDNLVFLHRTAREQLGEFNWSACGAGKHQMPIAAAGLALGGNVRVGLEDSLYIKPGQLAKSNAEQVTAVREIAERMGLEIATPAEAREILRLKGKDKVNF
jgi:Uncharacterized conserved protein